MHCSEGARKVNGMNKAHDVSNFLHKLAFAKQPMSLAHLEFPQPNLRSRVELLPHVTPLDDYSCSRVISGSVSNIHT